MLKKKKIIEELCYQGDIINHAENKIKHQIPGTLCQGLSEGNMPVLRLCNNFPESTSQSHTASSRQMSSNHLV